MESKEVYKITATRPIVADRLYANGYKRGEGCIISPLARISNSVKIGHYCIIEDNVTIEDNTVIGNYVLLKKGTIIGSDCFIDSYVKFSGNNRIGDGVIIRFNATIARGVTVEDYAFISPNVMTIYSEPNGIKKPGTVIGKWCHIGANSVIGAAVKIAPSTIIAPLSFVRRSINKPGTYIGNPARKLREL